MHLNYMAITPQTHEQKMKMYLKCTKKQLASMLIAANEALDARPIIVEFGNHATAGTNGSLPVVDNVTYYNPNIPITFTTTSSF